MNSSNLSIISEKESEAGVGITTFTRVTYSVLAFIALTGNTLVIVVIAQEKKQLKKSYNTLLLSLAVADVLTAINLMTSPAFVLGDFFPYPTSHVLGEVFCRLIWSRVFLFQLVVFSVYICLALATERWYAVIAPHKYSETFSRKRTLIYILLVWLWSLLLCCTQFAEVGYNGSYPLSQRCQWQLIWRTNSIRTIVAIVQVFLKVGFPSLTMFALFVHMVHRANKSTVASAASKAKLRGKITRMVGIACVMLVICFAPNQINYALAMAGKTRLDTKLHHSLGVLVFISSCLNPFIYGMSNKNYRRGYRKLLLNTCPTVCLALNKVSDESGVSDSEVLEHEHSASFIRRIFVREMSRREDNQA